MDIIISFVAIGGITFFGILALFQTVNQRFPPVDIDVYDRGVKQNIRYRTAGTTIVENNLFKLLVNQFNICGDIRMLEYDIIQKKLFNIIPIGLGRRYRAYRRFDYLFALKHMATVKKTKENPDGTITTQEVTKEPPIIVVDHVDGKNQIKATFSKEGFLLPYSISFTNEMLKEIEVSNGKAICARFIESDSSIDKLTDASNPIITTLLMALPLLLVVIANGVVIYLILSGVSDNVLKITEMQKAIVDALTAMS